MSKKDLYKILGVSRDATQDEIKAAYRKLAKENHPDKCKDESARAAAEENFKSISEAYSILSDPQKRNEYDHPRPGNMFGGGPFGTNPFGGTAGFEFFFSRKPATLEVTINLSVNESFNGCKKRVRYQRDIPCVPCGGSGSGNKKMNVKCNSCGGTGLSNMVLPGMRFSCGMCNGKGMMSRFGCEECNCSGVKSTTAEVDVDVPKGCPDKHVIGIRGAGNFSKNGMSSGMGDLFIRTMIVGDDLYKVNFPDITVDVPVSYPTALLGGSAVIPSPHGNIILKIPPRTSHGTILNIPGKGLKSSPHSSLFGNLRAMIIIAMPTMADGAEDIVKSLDSDLFEYQSIREFEEKVRANGGKK